MGTERCAATRDITTNAELCPQRADCERFAEFTRHGPGDQPAELWLCASEDFEARIPRPCAGRTTRLSARPHPLCRDCRRWQFGITHGITPDFSDNGGGATCVDKVRAVHPVTVGDAQALCAPAR